MNIVEAYIKFKGQLLIFVSGLSGCGKTYVAKNIARDLKIKIIDQFDYYKKDYINKTTLQDGTEINNWHTDEAIDWDLLNEDINTFKKDGLVVSGFALKENNISSKDDIHIHLNITKQNCIVRRKEYLEKNKDKYKTEYENIDSPIEKLKMNQIIYPYYLESTKLSKINKFINMNILSEEEAYDDVFNSIIKLISEYLYKPHTEKTNKHNYSTHTPKVTDTTYTTYTTETKTRNKLSTDTITIHGELSEDPIYQYDQRENLNMVEYLTRKE